MTATSGLGGQIAMAIVEELCPEYLERGVFVDGGKMLL